MRTRPVVMVARWAAGTHARLLLYAGAVLASAAVAPSVALVTKMLLDDLTAQRAPSWPAIWLVLLSGGAASTPALVALSSMAVRHGLTEAAIAETFTRMERALSLADLERPQVQRRLQVVEMAARDAPMRVVEGTFGLAQTGLTLTIFSVALWSISPIAASALAASVVPLLLIQRRMARHAVATIHATVPYERVHMLFADMLWDPRVAQETKLFGSAPALLRRSLSALREAHRLHRARELVQVGSSAGLAGITGLVLAIGLAGLLARPVLPTPGEVTLFLAAVIAVQQSVLALTEQLSSAHEGVLALRETEELIGSVTNDQEVAPRRNAPGARTGIQASGVVYRYSHRSAPVLDGLDLHLPTGTRTAVVGANGAGKTTLLKIIAGLYTPDDGSVTLNGEPLGARLRGRFTAVFQDPARYDVSVGENITISGSGTDPAPAAGRVGMHRRLAALPRGYDTLLSRTIETAGQDQVAYLSGGEWQRVAAARAIHRTAATVLLLDEPAAHLDSGATSTLLDLIDEWMTPDRTVLMVTHRLEHARRMDRIAVVDQGRVVEEGTHDELLQVRGHYRRMWSAVLAQE